MFNVIRTYPAPSSLSLKKEYADKDVVEELQKIFYDKCYLCEDKEPISLNVEHFDPHKGDETKKFDWDNLYYVCARCNNLKLAKYNDLIDCTDPKYDVFKLIKHLPPLTPYQKKLIIEATSKDKKVQNTAALLELIFNTDHTINKKITGTYLRKKVFKKYNRFMELVNIYFDDESSKTKKDDALERLQVLMERKQEFSAFIRWIVLEDEKLNPLLVPYMD